MNYTEILNALKTASLFDLYRLNVSIQNEMEDPERIHQLRKTIKIGDQIAYFDTTKNALIDAIILEKNTKRVQIKNIHDQKIWNIPYYFLNIRNAQTDIQPNKEKLSKNNLRVNECVGFDKDGDQIIGIVIRLNHKTVTIATQNNKIWRVSYSFLFKVIDADIIKDFNKMTIETIKKLA
ncbi:MAG: hypothetical protein Q8S31_06885 [Alphaproteobacteria bacterium]|nr:hypothetical protein [Alphaproteobacteria bacterium]